MLTISSPCEWAVPIETKDHVTLAMHNHETLVLLWRIKLNLSGSVILNTSWRREEQCWAKPLSSCHFTLCLLFPILHHIRPLRSSSRSSSSPLLHICTFSLTPQSKHFIQYSTLYLISLLKTHPICVKSKFYSQLKCSDTDFIVFFGPISNDYWYRKKGAESLKLFFQFPLLFVYTLHLA